MLRLSRCRRWTRDTRGQDLLEYALLAGLLSLGVYSGALGLGGSVGGWYNAMDESVATKRELGSQITSEGDGWTTGTHDREEDESLTAGDSRCAPGQGDSQLACR